MAPTRKAHRSITTVRIGGRAEYEQLTPQEQEARHRAYEVVGEMRRGESPFVQLLTGWAPRRPRSAA